MSKTALPSSVNPATDRRQRPWNSDFCMYCFERIAVTDRLGRPQSDHTCLEMLQARTPAAPVPFN